MAAIRKEIKRGSLASYRRSAATARLRVVLSMETERLPSDGAVATLAAHAQRYRPHVVAATQNVSALQAHYSK